MRFLVAGRNTNIFGGLYSTRVWRRCLYYWRKWFWPFLHLSATQPLVPVGLLVVGCVLISFILSLVYLIIYKCLPAALFTAICFGSWYYGLNSSVLGSGHWAVVIAVAAYVTYLALNVSVWLILAVTLVWFNAPSSCYDWLGKTRRRLFTRKRRLLTMEEYDREGVEYTRKALEELRDFCKGPECDTWDVASRLKDAARFATFIQTGSHYSEMETGSPPRDGTNNSPVVWDLTEPDHAEGIRTEGNQKSEGMRTDGKTSHGRPRRTRKGKNGGI